MSKLNYHVSSPLFSGNEEKYVNNCLESGWISSTGEYIGKFEEKFAEFCNSKYAISCCNGTVALHLPLLALGIGPGDEVIVPTLTYIATANAVKYCGGTPVFVDSDPITWNINPELIKQKITANTKGIIVVHLYGHPVDMDPVLEIAKEHNLFIIEDSAEAHGAKYKGRCVGSIGDVGTFSFYGNKIITTGEGGMVVTSNKQLAERMRLLKGQGMDPNKRYWFPTIGYNYRMTNIEAAIGLGQLEDINKHLSKRREIARLYSTQLADLKNYIDLPSEMGWAEHAFWMYSILLKDTLKINRDQFMNEMEFEGIETRPFFYPMHIMPPYYEKDGYYPVAENLASKGMNIPTHGLLCEKDIVFISESIRRICKRFS